jgi:hypothetical protein
MIEFEKEHQEDRIARTARELHQVAHDIEQGRFEGPIWVLPKIRLLEPVKTEVEIRDRTHQLKREYMDRVEARLKVSPDMLDQAQVLRQAAANDLKSGTIDFDEVDSVLDAFSYAYGFDHRYQTFLKDTGELLEGRPRNRRLH